MSSIAPLANENGAESRNDTLPEDIVDDQRRRLAVKGKALGRKQLAKVGVRFTPDRILRWHRQFVAADARIIGWRALPIPLTRQRETVEKTTVSGGIHVVNLLRSRRPLS